MLTGAYTGESKEEEMLTVVLTLSDYLSLYSDADWLFPQNISTCESKLLLLHQNSSEHQLAPSAGETTDLHHLMCVLSDTDRIFPHRLDWF